VPGANRARLQNKITFRIQMTSPSCTQQLARSSMLLFNLYSLHNGATFFKYLCARAAVFRQLSSTVVLLNLYMLRRRKLRFHPVDSDLMNQHTAINRLLYIFIKIDFNKIISCFSVSMYVVIIPSCVCCIYMEHGWKSNL